MRAAAGDCPPTQLQTLFIVAYSRTLISFTCPVWDNLLQSSEMLLYFSCGLSIAFSSCSNPNKPGIWLQAQKHSRQDGFCYKKEKAGLCYCKTQHCSVDFMATVHPHFLVYSWISFWLALRDLMQSFHIQLAVSYP